MKDSELCGNMEFRWSDEVELEWELKPFLVPIPLLELVSEWLGLIINGDIILGNNLVEEKGLLFSVTSLVAMLEGKMVVPERET